ncbi:hypothetical protein FACS189491_05470 [Spirochaetia bacterium]|nr:hypothetical protein FACS189491_05470 [Spirochaetia bacterium]
MAHNIHLVGNAHIDIVWLWKWEEGFQEVRATFASALDRIKEHDDFIFTCASAYHYRLVEQADPALFERIKEAVKANRWRIVGGWWLQPDCNAPGGEAFVRQGLYGQGYFQEKFGKIATVGYNVDSFGHNGNLPQIFRKSGMNAYVFMRPGKSEKDLPAHLFTWEGVDGSQVAAYRIPPAYTTDSEWGPELTKKIAWFRDTLIKQEGVPLMCFYGVGNHGGGPTRENLKIIDELRKQDTALLYSDPETYFKETSGLKDRPVVRDDLQFHAIGCYSSLSRIKKANNLTEQQLLFAEKMLSVIGTNTDEYGKALNEGWKKVLVNQFHDSLGGCCIPDVYPKIFNAYGWCQETVNQMTVILFQGLAARVETFKEGSTAIVWNPHPWEVTQCIEVNGVCDRIQDITGGEIPFELVPTNAIASTYSHAARFNAILPPLGYTAYKLTGHRNAMDIGSLVDVLHPRTGSNILCSGPMEVAIDRESGAVSSIFDREKNQEYLGEEGIGLEIIDDDSDTWTHALSSYKGLKRKMVLQSFSLVSQGTVTVEYELVYTLLNSKAIMRVIVNGALRTVDLKLRVLWNEERRLLKLRIASAFKSNTFTTEIPYSAMVRAADGTERPIQRWVTLSDDSGEKGLAIINDGVYSCSAGPGVVGLTLLRSPVYSNHEPMHPRPDIYQRYVDQGEHEYHFQLRPWAGKTSNSEHTRRALELNQEPVNVVESFHAGTLPQEQSYCRISQDSTVILSTIKRAEKNDGWIIRAVEAAGKRGEAAIEFSWLGLSGKFSFEPYEIKTIKITDTGKTISEINLLEA